MSDKPENMALWESVEATPPSWVSKVNQRGGFSTITAHRQVKLATGLWGPYGGTWGLFDVEWGEIKNGAGDTVEITMSGVFKYPGGAFPIATDMQFRANGDSRKKLMTDATTKALSKLGFSADVFLGRFDDNKYVQEQRRLEQEQNAIHQPPPESNQPSVQPPQRTPLQKKTDSLLAIFGKPLCGKAKLMLIKEDGTHYQPSDPITRMGDANELERILNAGDVT